MKEITITGSEGLIGSTLCKYFEKQKRSINKLDLKFGHDLTDSLPLNTKISSFCKKLTKRSSIFEFVVQTTIFLIFLQDCKRSIKYFTNGFQLISLRCL